MKNIERKVITTSIPYVNAKPHIGFALEALYADVLARYYRGKIGNDHVRFISGTDEHGQKIQRKAEELGKSPRAFVDEISRDYRDVLAQLNISNDDFIRTTEERHIRGAQEFWRLMQTHGFIEKREFEGLYCVGCEEYKTEKELVDKKCPLHNAVPEALKEENYFFLLSQCEAHVKKWLAMDAVIPAHRRKEMMEFVNGGLQDIPVSRPIEKCSWGIPVPDDDTQVMYVWVEAITNYINALGFGANDEWKAWWSWTTHIIGKDINRFHTVMWPAMLFAAGIEMPMHVAIHGFITVDGKKMSKTLGNVIAPQELITRYGVDATRYLLMAEIPFASDGNFTWERFDALYTANLANGIGNLFSRVTNMVEKYCPNRSFGVRTAGSDTETGIVQLIELYKFDEALRMINESARAMDITLDQKKPWTVAKEHPESVEEILAPVVGNLQIIANVLSPFMPETAEKMMEILHAEKITKPVEPLFPRLDSSLNTLLPARIATRSVTGGKRT